MDQLSGRITVRDRPPGLGQVTEEPHLGCPLFGDRPIFLHWPVGIEPFPRRGGGELRQRDVDHLMDGRE
ncbi:MAG: hypothetical protein JAY90_13840 [Candidatus Thiodiazotropha lotti]|nr:hypothetical protein [Candidatus Thiodiazotropha lotti]